MLIVYRPLSSGEVKRHIGLKAALAAPHSTVKAGHCGWKHPALEDSRLWCPMAYPEYQTHQTSRNRTTDSQIPFKPSGSSQCGALGFGRNEES